MDLFLHGFILKTPKFGCIFLFPLILFSEWLVFTNFVGIIFRPSGSNFIVMELVRLDTFQKKSSSLLQNCFRRPYICCYRIKPFFQTCRIFFLCKIFPNEKCHFDRLELICQTIIKGLKLMITVVPLPLLFALCQLIFYVDNPSLIFLRGFSGESQNPESQRYFIAVTIYLLLVVISFPE